MKHSASLLIFTSLLALSACNQIPGPAYFNRGDPENLLDLSSEVVNMSLSSNSSLSELSGMISQDPPTRAELSCSTTTAVCSEAKTMLEQHGVPVQFTGGGSDVALVYERIVARDCENRFIDNTINPYNMHHLTFGCSITGNMVQMVSDRQQFTNPNLLDFQSADKAGQSYKKYLKPGPLFKGSGQSVKSAVSSAGGAQ